MIPQTGDIRKPFPTNLYEVSHYPFEIGFVAFTRTSPQQSGPQRDGEYQYQAMQTFANDRGLTIAKHFRANGVDGRVVGKPLLEAIEYAKRIGFPIMGLDYERLCRVPMKLASYAVDFVSVLPFVSPDKLLGLRKRAFNQLNPDRKGGRPKSDIPESEIREWHKYGMSYRDIGKLTGVSKSAIDRICKTVPKLPSAVIASHLAE